MDSEVDFDLKLQKYFAITIFLLKTNAKPQWDKNARNNSKSLIGFIKLKKNKPLIPQPLIKQKPIVQNSFKGNFLDRNTKNFIMIFNCINFSFAFQINLKYI